MKSSHNLKILVIRRDNIGDLILTTPLIAALRSRYPQAWIGVYTNDYASEILNHHPALDQLFIYRKLKHLKSQGLARICEFFQIVWQRWQLRATLRAKKLDWVLLATPEDSPRNLALARSFKPAQVAGFSNGKSTPDVAIALDTLVHQPESARVLQLLHAIDSTFVLPNTLEQWRAQIFPHPQEVVDLCQQHPFLNRVSTKKRVAVHISARKPSQRWAAENFSILIEKLIQQQAEVILFWSPGSNANPLHPGDDEKAQAIIQSLTVSSQEKVLALPTTALRTLIAGISLCDTMICSDGGALHIAAGLGKSIVCLFGKSEAQRWRPWGVPYQLLQKETFEVKDISVDEVLHAYIALSNAHPTSLIAF